MFWKFWKKKTIPHTCSIRLSGATNVTTEFGLGTIRQLTDGVNTVDVVLVGIHYDDISKLYSFDYVAIR